MVDGFQTSYGAPQEVLSNDTYQYYFGGYVRIRRGGWTPTGWPLTSRASAPGTASWVTTSSVLPVEAFPQYESWRLASWVTEGAAPFEPFTGEWQVATDHDDQAYKRLTRTIDLRGACAASVDFTTSYRIETDWDYFFVEVHPVGSDDWTTLPDENGHSAQGTGQSCTSGWAAQLHPFLDHYQTLNSDGTCSPTGTTGEWHAATGPSDGVEQWSVDLSAYAASRSRCR